MSQLDDFKSEKKELEEQLSKLVNEFVKKYDIYKIDLELSAHYGIGFDCPLHFNIRLTVSI